MNNKKLITVTQHGQSDVKEISSLFRLCVGKKNDHSIEQSNETNKERAFKIFTTYDKQNKDSYTGKDLNYFG